MSSLHIYKFVLFGHLLHETYIDHVDTYDKSVTGVTMDNITQIAYILKWTFSKI